MSLIYGINPLVISQIVVTKHFRIGPHPYKLKLLKKKNPILGYLRYYERNIFDGWYIPKVKILGADGSVLLVIQCNSIDHARSLRKQLNDQLVKELSQYKNIA